MKALFLAVLFLFSFSGFADVYVKGHYRSNGSYVKSHYRSSPDSSRNNNWSTQGNTNPYTFKAGTRPRSNYNAPKQRSLFNSAPKQKGRLGY